MTDSYFTKFPIINYKNIATRNITERVKIIEIPHLIPTNFYPFEIPEGMRSDQLAHQYYKDSTEDWLIYIVNDIVDPYYGWPLNQEEFDNYIVQKYGSIDYAQQSIAAWRTNWPSDDNNLTVAYFNSLPVSIKKYYVPMTGAASKIVGYTRRQEDWIVSTNQILSLGMTMSSNSTFANGELLIVSSGGLDIGTSEVIQANSTVMSIQNVRGNNAISNTIRSRANNLVNGSISSIKTVIQNISLQEQAYWEPAFWYDVEEEANTNKKYIDLLEANFALEASEKVRQELNS